MVQLTRTECEYVNHSSKYHITREDRMGKDEINSKEETFHKRQFYVVYQIRHRLLRERIIENAKRIVGKDVKIVELENLENTNGMVVVTGTLIKRMSKRPSVLKELANDDMLEVYQCSLTNVNDNLSDESDYLELEDEKQIIKLTGRIDMKTVSTGCAVGLYGKQLHGDYFHVEQIIYPLPSPQKELSNRRENMGEVAFVSGLLISGDAHKDSDTVSAFSLFSHWVCGELGMDSDHASTVSRVIIAGQSIDVGERSREFANSARYLTKGESAPNTVCIQQLDALIARLTANLSVDLMGGIGDPCTHMMPQQPIHRVAFPQASHNGGMLTMATNPYEFSLDLCDIVVLSGRSVDDQRLLSDQTSSCNILSSLLKYQHLAPTAPDTIDSFPFSNRDPFIIDRQFPHVMVVGNQPKAESRVVDFSGNRQTLLISLPKFSQTHMVALLNLNTMQVRFKQFTC